VTHVTHLTDTGLAALIKRDGYAFVHADEMRTLLKGSGTAADWEQFAGSWNQLELDTYMADGGRYRRRRHAIFAARPGSSIERQAHQPHYQTLD